MNVSRIKVVTLFNVLTGLTDVPASLKFHYARAKNLAKLSDEVEIIKNLAKPFENYVEYESKRVALCRELCEYVGNPPEPSIVNGNYQFSDENKVIVEDKIKELQKEFSEVIAEDQQRQSELKEFLAQEVNIDFHKVKMDLIPDQVVLNGEGSDALALIIEE
jgi:hypothetical protein